MDVHGLIPNVKKKVKNTWLILFLEKNRIGDHLQGWALDISP
jgi:hypothetical protein